MSRYVVGIDLGTTNSALAYADTQGMAADAPAPLKALALPWKKKAERAVGTFAREHGAKVPGRLVGSAKSWLSHPGVDRRAALLPWNAPADVAKVSPVEASAAYLGHVRDAWNHLMAGKVAEDRLEHQ